MDLRIEGARALVGEEMVETAIDIAVADGAIAEIGSDRQAVASIVGGCVVHLTDASRLAS